MEGIILGAGYGQRMGGAFKCGIKLFELPLAFYPASNFLRLGVKRIIFVAGPHNVNEAKALTNRMSDYLGVEVDLALNPRPELGNATSLLAGVRELVDESFVASVCDHLHHPDILPLTRGWLKGKLLIVAADKRPKAVDLDEATKLIYDGNRVVDIGKQLKKFTHVDSGVFFGRKELGEINFRGSLSDLLKALKEKGGIGEFEGLPWFDVDTPSELEEVKRGKRLGYALEILRALGIKLHVDRPAPLL